MVGAAIAIILTFLPHGAPQLGPAAFARLADRETLGGLPVSFHGTNTVWDLNEEQAALPECAKSQEYDSSHILSMTTSNSPNNLSIGLVDTRENLVQSRLLGEACGAALRRPMPPASTGSVAGATWAASEVRTEGSGTTNTALSVYYGNVWSTLFNGGDSLDRDAFVRQFIYKTWMPLGDPDRILGFWWSARPPLCDLRVTETCCPDTE